MDYDKIRVREYGRRAMWTSATVVAALAAFAFMLFWEASAPMRSLFSSWLSLDTDLGGCAISFARLLMVATALSIGLGIISAGLVVSNAVDVFSYKRSFRVYRKLLLVGVGLTTFFLLPLFFGNGAWETGGHYGVPRIYLVNACIASHHTTFYRLYSHLLIVVFAGWISVLAQLVLRRAIADGRDPGQLSDDPLTRQIQLRTLEWTRRLQASRRIVFKVAITVLAAALFYSGAWSMKPAVVRFIHTFTWERQKANVVETGVQCVLEVKVRRDWVERSRADCSSDPATVLSTPAPGEGAWRITKIPTARLTYRTPGGVQYSFDVTGDFYVKMPTSVGTEIEVLRNPTGPEGIDKVFDVGDVNRMFYKLLMIIVGAGAIYYLWVRRPQNSRPI